MCGIAGVLRLAENAALPAAELPRVVARMNDIQSHRGPDAAGLWHDRAVALGHRRLAVLDLSEGGNQPFVSEDGRVVLTYNGECYNYRELRRGLESRGCVFRTQSDTEVVLRLYEQHGAGFVGMMSGMFALAIWDARRSELLLVRDRLGIKPLYYTCQKGVLAFASELKALRVLPGFDREIDPESLMQYVQLLSVPQPGTVYRSCRKLLPGTVLRVRDGALRTEEYWSLRERIEHAPDADGADFGDRFSQVVRGHMVSDVPVGAFLSGGLDSSYVCGLASRCTAEPLRTFSAAFDGEQEDESRVAQLVAGHLGTKHRAIRIAPDLLELLPKLAWHMDEPFGIAAALPTFVLAREAAREVKVVLTGDGADETLAGYPWRHAAEFPRRRWDRLPHLARRLATACSHALDMVGPKRGPEAYRRLRRSVRYAERDEGQWYSGFLRYIDEESLFLALSRSAWAACRDGWRRNRIAAAYGELPDSPRLTRKLYADVATSLVDEMLTKVDRTTMAHGLEARVPFLDHEWVEYCFALDSSAKLRGTVGKGILRERVRGCLPPSVADLPKHGFNVPVGDWFRSELREFLADHLLSESFLGQWWVDRRGMREIVDRHLGGQGQYGMFLYALLAFALWERSQGDLPVPVRAQRGHLRGQRSPSARECDG